MLINLKLLSRLPVESVDCAHVSSVACHKLTGAGGALLYENSGARERAFNLIITEQLQTFWQFRNTFLGIYESSRDLFLVFRSP